MKSRDFGVILRAVMENKRGNETIGMLGVLWSFRMSELELRENFVRSPSI